MGLRIHALGVQLGGNHILQNLDLEVQRGEFLVLLGPSGCGKSTLLHAIAGLHEVTSGRIEIAGRDCTQAEPSERSIGMVFQSYALYPTMTVEKNLSFGLRLAGLPKAEIAQRVAQAAHMLQLEPLLHRKPAQLSGGQRQRVAIGRALVRQADVFLLDEPLSNLDAQLRTELRRELKLLHQRLGATMVYVTHDQVEAMTLATRIVVMRGGRIQQIGAPAEVYARPANRFVAGFLGSPGMNFVEGQVQQGRFECPAFALPLAQVALAHPDCPNGAALLGLRPEHLRLREQGAHTARVQLVEPMGNHAVVWLECQGHVLSALLHDGAMPQPGDAVRFDIESGRASLFDAQSEQRL